MARKLSLPLTRGEADSASAPSVDAIRKKLGGRAISEPGAGDLVSLADRGGDERIGVVLFARADEIAVWVAEGIVRRTERALLHAAQTAPSPEVQEIANDARVFGSLAEGQRVGYEPGDAAFGEGTLVEKCRFGALVERHDRTVLGIGFRRVWGA
jgi:hypothetical protein